MKADDFLRFIDDSCECLPYWADALEDEGRGLESEALRWCLARKKRPLTDRRQANKVGLIVNSYIQAWWAPDHWSETDCDYCMLPQALTHVMRHDVTYEGYDGRYFRELAGAWQGFMQAYEEMRHVL